MSVALLFNQKPTEEWQRNLQKLLPETKVEVYPIISNPEDVEFIATWKPHKDYIKEFPNLKVVQSVGAGIDHLLHTEIPDSVKVTRIVDSALKQEMFEHVLACIMTSMKNLLTYHKDQLQQEWNPKNYTSIHETTITILGLGEIGKLVAERFVALGFRVKGWSNSQKNINGVETFVGKEGLNSAIANTDFIVNILPLTTETESILNYKFFNQCSKQTVLINVGRGAHLVEKDLLIAIDEKQIKEAYLDVFREEPLPENHPFWSNKNIYITPHIASVTNATTALQQVATNYKKLKNMETLENEVSLDKGY
ncbi:glyoxylate/hydroxypyruvate reductase A [Empedobacter sp. 225-1]|uniref:2-hydroxyacid dehydrogenase n=1 Tax=unclassified Empedobacter TaxID=2643773 RepID=UPI002575DD98|nr:MULTISPECIES: glyoxylate/hydroxypyruvate reductase A [unclassified Empedobacter]MDM1524182.1 glyoxylate/hydroxypyruvate reductase A [Empedobacter sp. 225-1]MDM1544116.1 glyoxylate/hydroxypyruvate reductase A [Empedobacter sp. 189-2]